MATFTALIDANVLYSIAVTDLVMELASTGLFRARWSQDIHAEWMRHVQKDLPHLPVSAIERRRTAMDRAFPNALVCGYESLIPALTLPDPGDRHVLAAAIAGRADGIVTYNLKDFPTTNLAPHGIEAQHSDEFLNHQRTLDERQFLTCVKAVRGRLKNPKYDPQGYIDNLRGCQLQVIAVELEKAKALI